jgi:hypothetical protein
MPEHSAVPGYLGPAWWVSADLGRGLDGRPRIPGGREARELVRLVPGRGRLTADNSAQNGPNWSQPNALHDRWWWRAGIMLVSVVLLWPFQGVEMELPR